MSKDTKNATINISKEIMEEFKLACNLKKVKFKPQVEEILLKWVRKIKLNKMLEEKVKEREKKDE